MIDLLFVFLQHFLTFLFIAYSRSLDDIRKCCQPSLPFF